MTMGERIKTTAKCKWVYTRNACRKNECVRSHIISNFFTDNYDHPIYESGIQVVDMVYLQRPL